MNQISMLLSGLLFGVGLALGGMNQPAKVLAFLDVTGHWDPSLLALMASALVVHRLLQSLIMRRAAPVFDSKFHVPTTRVLDTKLVVGAAVFGVGWGIAGICPGSAFAAFGSAAAPALVAIAGMGVGMAVAYFVHDVPHGRTQPQAETTSAG